ncbi:hypothetical protein [Microcoleus sp. B7-D4]|uniref:hypothetical protein n=1 Tax=Microcoleus sp. B7-D4 TaxID=2818696 RepID=UPI002FD65472
MISEDTRIDHERITEDDVPSVSSALSALFGAEFCEANLDQKLALLEAVAYSLREGGSFFENLMGVIGCGLDTPGIQTNEGLRLMAVLQVAIVEGYSALAFTQK